MVSQATQKNKMDQSKREMGLNISFHKRVVQNVHGGEKFVHCSVL